MKKLRFRYEMHLQFDAPVNDHRFTLKCIPMSNQRQVIQKLETYIYPNEMLGKAEDSFGNLCIYGYTDKPHTRFDAVVSGEALTGCLPYEPAEENYRLGRYRYPTPYTKPGPALKEYYRKFQEEYKNSKVQMGAEENLPKSIVLMHMLHRDISYVQGVTTVDTTAEEALAGGKGVCQDYSHIMIALCQMAGIPARYVVGMLIGEGLSHAWVEIYHDGCWYALDPTNDLMVDDQHIKISAGRNYHDCRINQGAFRGIMVHQTQTIGVSVEEIGKLEE